MKINEKIKHYLNVCDINGADIEPVDIITFGSPCQDMSIAGTREGLKHSEQGDDRTTRSGLFYEAVRIINEMRKATNGEYPKYAIWENVPGAFSSQKGEDFRAVLEELAKVKDSDAIIPRPPKDKWADAGAVLGDGWSIAWRVLDAQFHGIPQRRRRIILVTDFTDGRAGEILFECHGLPGYPAESGAPWQGTAGDAAGGTTADDREGGNAIPTICLQGNGIDRADTAGCNGRGWTEDVCYTLNTIDRPAVVYDARGNGDGAIVSTITGDHEGHISDYTAIAVETRWQATVYESHPQDSRITECADGISPTVSCKFAKGTADTPIVLEQIRYIVRRLTPTECARLQGFPDWWSELPTITDMSDEDYDFWCDVLFELAKIEQTARWDELSGNYMVWREVKPNKKKHETFEPYWLNTGKPYKPKTPPQMVAWYNKLHTDGAEYKMWGNGVALPVVRVPLHEMAKLGAKTMGSLFDGSSGFPLAGYMDGIKTLWTSEIEPYPIAISKGKWKE
ncbi:MAG: DNA cytosine methyltransferase [Bacteroides sp.]